MDVEEALRSEPGVWHFVWHDQSATIVDLHGNLIATLGPSSDEKVRARASLIIASPDLYDTLLAVQNAFQVIAREDDERYSRLGRDMLSIIQETMDHANFLAQVKPDMLVEE